MVEDAPGDEGLGDEGDELEAAAAGGAAEDAAELLVTADGGGSDGSRTRSWKLELQRLADEIQLGRTDRSGTRQRRRLDTWWGERDLDPPRRILDGILRRGVAEPLGRGSWGSALDAPAGAGGVT